MTSAKAVEAGLIGAAVGAVVVVAWWARYWVPTATGAGDQKGRVYVWRQ